MTDTARIAPPESADARVPSVVRRVEEFWQDRSSGAQARILAGATLAFADLGYHGASTREIAIRAGMSPSAVYIHFASKEDLFLHIALEGHRASTSALIDAGQLASEPAAKLRLAVASFTAWNAEMNVFSRMVEYEMRQHRGPKFIEVWRLRRGVEKYLRDLIAEGIESGVFRVADPEGMKILILSLCIDVARWYQEDSQRSPTSIGVQYSELALSLVGA